MAVPGVIERLQDPEKTVRLKAMDVLKECGPTAKDAVPDLEIALKGTDRDSSEHAALALANIDPRDKEVLPVLIKMLNDPAQKVNAIKALAEMGNSARPAVPALEHLIAADQGSVERQAAVTALPKIDGADAVPALERAMSGDTDGSVRVAAATALGRLGSTSGSAISALVGALSSDLEALREAASDALGNWVALPFPR